MNYLAHWIENCSAALARAHDRLVLDWRQVWKRNNKSVTNFYDFIIQ